jgi:hypothetical protein
MGVSPLAASLSSSPCLLSSRSARYWWRTLLWRGHQSYTQQWVSNAGPPSDYSRPNTSSLPSQIRATSRRSADRASQCIQRAPLSRKHFSPRTTLRRWMLPLVERGPPVTERTRSLFSRM